MKKKIEILAPAGSRDALTAAVRCGANAVYLGGKELNARRGAQNFDADELRDAVAYCHMRDVKVYLTLNTLVTDDETPALLRGINDAAWAGVDAVLVQDLGVLRVLRETCPDLPVHASTQMVIHNLSSARMAARLGMTRAALARECSKEEIAAITADCGIETEVFVHGALCMCVSGQCYLSSMIGQRSGNRGLCAQPCRLPFAGPDRQCSLSLKDMTLAGQVRELEELGVASLKIEGRMKRPEYVAAAVTACRRALEGDAVDFDSLAAVFSRSGFTAGYYNGALGGEMFGVRSKEDVTATTNKLLSGYEGLYRNETPLVPLDFVFTMREDQPVTLAVTDDRGHCARVQGDVPQTARTKPTDEELARRSLAKTGGTPFYLRELTCELDEGLMLPVSALNSLRQQAVAQLEQLREETSPRWITTPQALTPISPPRPTSGNPVLRLRLQRLEQLTPDLWDCAELITLPLAELERSDSWHQHVHKVCGELPAVLFPAAEARAKARVAALAEGGLTHLSVGSLGGVDLAEGLGLTLHGDPTLNIINSKAAAQYKDLGLIDLCLSFELALEQAQRLERVLPMGLLAYGYLPLMTTRNCPIRGAKGCGTCPGHGSLTDRLGNQFTVDCVERETSRLLNTVPLYLADRKDDLLGLDFATLYFTQESPDMCRRMLTLYQNGGGDFHDKRTGGLYYRGLL